MAGCPSETPIAKTLDQKVAVFLVVGDDDCSVIDFFLLRTADDHDDHNDHNGGVA